VFPRPVINEGRLDELSLLLPEKRSGAGPRCSLKGCINAVRASLSSLASVEGIQMDGLQFQPRNFKLNIRKSFLLGEEGNGFRG